MSTPPPHQPAGSNPGSGSNLSADGASFFQALFDFNFTTFATPKIVKIVYIVGTVIIALATVFLVLTSFRHFGGGFGAVPIIGLLQLVAAPILGLFYLAFLRMSLELYHAVIRLSEDVHHGRGRI